jgi:hypothetical protein
VRHQYPIGERALPPCYQHAYSVGRYAEPCAHALREPDGNASLLPVAVPGLLEDPQAECMRRHGISNFPDPTLSVPPQNASVTDAAGIYFVLPAGLDFQSPAVKQARSACGSGRGPF